MKGDNEKIYETTKTELKTTLDTYTKQFIGNRNFKITLQQIELF